MSVGKILLLLVNLKYLIILIIYFHLQNLCSSKSVSRHLLIIILIFFFRGVASWGERAGGWDQSSLTISVRKFPWKAIPGFHTLVHRRDSLECRCVGMHREGWDGMGWAVTSQEESSLSPKNFRDVDWGCHGSCSLI